MVGGVIDEMTVWGMGAISAAGGFLTEELLLADEGDSGDEAANEDINNNKTEDDFAAVFEFLMAFVCGWCLGQFFGNNGGGWAGV